MVIKYYDLFNDETIFWNTYCYTCIQTNVAEKIVTKTNSMKCKTQT